MDMTTLSLPLSMLLIFALLVSDVIGNFLGVTRQCRFDGIVQIVTNDDETNIDIQIEQAGLDAEGGFQATGSLFILRKNGVIETNELLLQLNKDGLVLSTPWENANLSFQPGNSDLAPDMEGMASAVLVLDKDAVMWENLYARLIEGVLSDASWMSTSSSFVRIEAKTLQRAVANVISGMTRDFALLRDMEGMALWDELGIDENRRRITAMSLLRGLSDWIKTLPVPEDILLGFKAELNSIIVHLEAVIDGQAILLNGTLSADQADQSYRLEFSCVQSEEQIAFNWMRDYDETGAWLDDASLVATGEMAYTVLISGTGEYKDTGESANNYDVLVTNPDGTAMDIRVSWVDSLFEAKPPERVSTLAR